MYANLVRKFSHFSVRTPTIITKRTNGEVVDDVQVVPNDENDNDDVLSSLLFESVDSRSWDETRTLLSEIDDASSLARRAWLARDDASGDTLLHLACRRRAPVDVVEALRRRWPASTSRRNASCRLPLHEACASVRPSEAVVRALVAADPRTAAERCGYGWTPLHVAVDRRDPPPGVVRALTEAAPGTARARDDDGDAPPRWFSRTWRGDEDEATSSPSFRTVLSLLLTAYEHGTVAGSLEEEEDGRPSLSNKVVRRRSVVPKRMIERLLRDCNDACRGDRRGNFPLHVFCATAEVVPLEEGRGRRRS